jgi:hypothetical protein
MLISTKKTTAIIINLPSKAQICKPEPRDREPPPLEANFWRERIDFRPKRTDCHFQFR